MMQYLLQGLRLVRMLNFDHDARLGPLGVDIAVTSACNYQCSFCGTHSYLKQHTNKPATLDKAVLSKLLSDLSKLGTRSILFAANGEPFLSWEMLEQVRQNKSNLRIEVMTNGSLLDRLDRELFNKFSKITISLNSGNGKSHQVIHGYRGDNQFPHIIHNIERLLDLPHGSDKIELNYVVTKENEDELPDFLVLAKKWRVKYHARPEDKRALSSGNDKSRRLYPCYVGFIQPTVAANGSVLQCYGCLNPLGNLYKHDFKAIWQRKRNRATRFQAAAMGLTNDPVTASCYDCPNAIGSSAVFHSIYSKIPLLEKRAK